MQRGQIWGEEVMVPFLYQCPLVSYPPCSSVCLEPQRWEETSGKQRAFRHSLQPRWQRKCHCYWMITLRAHMKHSNHHGMLKPKLNVNQVSSINTVYRNALFNYYKATPFSITMHAGIINLQMMYTMNNEICTDAENQIPWALPVQPEWQAQTQFRFPACLQTSRGSDPTNWWQRTFS